MLTLENLTLHYGHSQILFDVSLTAHAGAITCVLGTNGVGKTSLLKAISGTHPRSGGTMQLGGVAMPANIPAHVLARMGVGYVPQGRDIFPLMSVRENVAFGLEARGVSKAEEFLFGSVSNKIIHHAKDCTVWVVA